MSEVLKLILYANNTCMSAFKRSNDSAENLNNKDTAFLIINKKLSCAIKILRNSQDNIESTNPAHNTAHCKMPQVCGACPIVTCQCHRGTKSCYAKLFRHFASVS